MEHIIELSLYITLFLFGTTLLQVLSNRISFPYTVALLFVGFFSQFIVHFFHLPIHLSLSPDIIYFFLLPILLFEASMHINVHQFKLQFKTITFFATFGLMISVFAVGFGLALLLKLPLAIALLFGAIISATDPIAVLSLFKSLGAPKRLALIADGESMFNDATGVIAFRIISGFVLANQSVGSQVVFSSLGDFLYVFIGSILFGIILGYIFSIFIQKIIAERILIAAIITSLALGSFVIAEHFFHLSGVITTVIAGIAFGNMARGKIRYTILRFVEEYFAYIGFVALSVVFFFASFNLDLQLFTQSLGVLGLVVLIVLLARALSVYGTAFLTNYLPFFKDEPNIPLSWQHILNWGGLRGVIPLVLVYSLPDSFEYKNMMLSFTFACLLFTIIVNGLTIKWLLIALKLHIPRKEEEILKNEFKLFSLANTRERLHHLPNREFTPGILKEIEDDLFSQEMHYKRNLLKTATPEEFLLSLKLQALTIERRTLRKLYSQGRFPESVLNEFESELDLQEDALEYPEIHKIRGVSKTGEIDSSSSFRKRVNVLRRFVSKHPFLSKIFAIHEEDIILERYSLLRGRILTSQEVIEYLEKVKDLFDNNKEALNAVDEVCAIQEKYISSNQEELQKISSEYPELIISHQRKIITQLLSLKYW